MKKYIFILFVFVLSACGGGSGGGINNTSGGSAYQTWLDNGNTGSEQDFLDSLVSDETDNQNDTSNDNNQQNNEKPHYVSVSQMAISNPDVYSLTNMPWDKHGGFNRITYSADSNVSNSTTSGSDSGDTHTVWFFNEKELNLANYGVYYIKQTTSGTEFYAVETETNWSTAWINNREGVGKNVYTPTEGTVFTGGTLAYLYSGSTAEPTFIKGDAEYTYSATSPKLVLDFDDYYKFILQNGSNNIISGTNNTGNSSFDIRTGTETSASNDVPKNTGQYSDIGFLKKDSIEEVVGKYSISFSKGSSIGDAKNRSFSIEGAFGATKQ